MRLSGSWHRAGCYIYLLAIYVQIVAARSFVDRDADDTCFPPDRDASGLVTGAPTCAILGETDFYGLGVRLGIYLNWIAGYLANNFVASELAGSLDTNSIFLFALTATTTVNSFLEQIWIIDSIILQQLSFGCIFSVMSIWGRRTAFYKQGHFGGWGTHFRLCLCTIVSAYSLWFWTAGITNPDPDCFLREQCNGLRIFLFANLKATGGVRIFYVLASAVCCVYYGTQVIVATITLGHNLARAKKRFIPVEHEAGGCPGIQSSKALYLTLSGLNLFWMIFSMLAVEFTLNFNNVSGVLASGGVTNPGQLLPLLIGIFSTIRIFWVMYKENVIDRRRERAKGYGPLELETVSSSGNIRIKRGPAVIANEPEQKWWFRLISMWLPWVGCFESWRTNGGLDPVPSLARPPTFNNDAVARGSYSTLKEPSLAVNERYDAQE